MSGIENAALSGQTQDGNRETAASNVSETDALLKACKWFMQQLEDGVLVRDISRDGEPDWHMRMLRFTVSLSEASEAIARAEESAD